MATGARRTVDAAVALSPPDTPDVWTLQDRHRYHPHDLLLISDARESASAKSMLDGAARSRTLRSAGPGHGVALLAEARVRDALVAWLQGPRRRLKSGGATPIVRRARAAIGCARRATGDDRGTPPPAGIAGAGRAPAAPEPRARPAAQRGQPGGLPPGRQERRADAGRRAAGGRRGHRRHRRRRQAAGGDGGHGGRPQPPRAHGLSRARRQEPPARRGGDRRPARGRGLLPRRHAGRARQRDRALPGRGRGHAAPGRARRPGRPHRGLAARAQAGRAHAGGARARSRRPGRRRRPGRDGRRRGGRARRAGGQVQVAQAQRAQRGGRPGARRPRGRLRLAARQGGQARPEPAAALLPRDERHLALLLPGPEHHPRVRLASTRRPASSCTSGTRATSRRCR